MRKFFSLLMATAFVFSISCKSTKTGGSAGLNQLTKKEKEEDWVLLFDGKTSEGWRGNNKDHFPTGWQVVDGTLHCKKSGQGEAGSRDGGDIITTKEYSNFHLKLDGNLLKVVTQVFFT